ncbi:hypothetical protein ACOMHN_044327 [Nucella lapillus]
MENYTVIHNTSDSTDHQKIPDYYRDMASLAYDIQEHYLMVICAIGFPGNLAAILTIITVTPVRPAAFLVALLAASDSAALLTKLIVNQLYFNPHYVIDDHYCRSLAVTDVCSSFANWVLVLIAFERLVAVMLPVIRHRFLSKRRVYCVCVAIGLLIFSLHAPKIAGWEERGGKCRLQAGMSHYGDTVWPWLTIIVYALLPLCLLVVITIVLVVTLRRAGIRREELMEGAMAAGMLTVTRELHKSERAITSMTIAASLLFILLVLPQCLYYILFHFTDAFSSMTGLPRVLLYKQIAHLLADSTHALNFYLYFFSVRRFRVYFWKMLRCKRTFCPKPHSLQTASSRIPGGCQR